MAAQTQYLYVLKLEQNKFYVGITLDPDTRVGQHFDGGGSEWTTMYPPIDIVEVTPIKSSFEEDMRVKQLMSIHGIDNVRGGSYSQPNLNVDQMKTLERELRGASGQCFRCGSEGHFSSNCQVGKQQQSLARESTSSYRRGACFRCGRTSHYASQCYARTDVNGVALSDDESDDNDEDYD